MGVKGSMTPTLQSLIRALIVLAHSPTNFRLFQTERNCKRDNFRFDEMDGYFPERVENAVGKGEIACYW